MKLQGVGVGDIISIHSGDYTILMPNPDSIITMSSVSLPCPANWTQNVWTKVVIYNLDPANTYMASDFSILPDVDGDNSDVEDPIMSVQVLELFNISLNIIQTTLPVTFIKFEANLNKSNVFCKWVTGSEINNAGFEIQRSFNGKTFSKIGWSNASKSHNVVSNYSFTDETPIIGVSYYRLKQVDKDGKYSYSEIRSVNNKIEDLDISLHPNPVSESIFITGLEEGNTVSIYSLRGELMETIPYTSNGIDISSYLKGVYFVNIPNGVQLISKRFIVQ